jgi:hypothetical protein
MARPVRGRTVTWWGWALIGWAALAAAAGVLIGRSIRAADRREQHPRSVGLMGLAAANAATLDRIVADWQPPHRDGPPYPRMPDQIDPSLAGAILTLSYCTTKTAARFWVTECARRGADWDLQRQLWDGWQREHARDVTTLHTDPEDKPR